MGWYLFGRYRMGVGLSAVLIGAGIFAAVLLWQAGYGLIGMGALVLCWGIGLGGYLAQRAASNTTIAEPDEEQLPLR